MSAPSVIVDADLSPGSNDIYYVVESDSVWRTLNLTDAGAADWEQIWIEGALLQGELGGLLRIKCAPGDPSLIYVLGWGTKDSQVSPFVLRSTSAGATWSEHWIDEEVATRDYTVTYKSESKTQTGNANFAFDQKHTRIGDEDTTYNPWAMATRLVGPAGMGAWRYLTQAADNIHNYGSSYGGSLSGILGTANDSLGSTDHATAEGWMTEYLGSYGADAGINQFMPKDAARTQVEFGLGHVQNGTWTVTAESWVFWNKPSPIIPSAFDVARSNGNWIYVGLVDKILKSEDGGFTWEVLTDDHGAYDIQVDPQAAGVIYYWSSEGDLNLWIADALNATLDTETPEMQHGRLARDLNSGKLWAISENKVRLYEYGSWTDLKTGLVSGKSLKSYLGGKVIYLDDSDIQYSADYGTTWAAKKGGWSTYSSPVVANLMKETS